MFLMKRDTPAPFYCLDKNVKIKRSLLTLPVVPFTKSLSEILDISE